MFKYAVQILPSLSASEATASWKTVYEGEMPEHKMAAWDAKRQAEWIRETPRQYGDPVGVRAIVNGEVISNLSLWTS